MKRLVVAALFLLGCADAPKATRVLTAQDVQQLCKQSARDSLLAVIERDPTPANREVAASCLAATGDLELLLASNDCAVLNVATRSLKAGDTRLTRVLHNGKCLYDALQEASRLLVQTTDGVDALLDALQSRKPEVQQAAAYGLLALREKDERVSERLALAFLERKNTEEVRIGVASALTVFSSPRLRPERFLAVIRSEHESIRIRQGALEILSRIPDASARRSLIETLEDRQLPRDLRATVPRSVAEGEKHWRGPREDIVPTLAAIAGDPRQDTSLRTAALSALHYYGDSALALQTLARARLEPVVQQAATPIRE